MNDLDELMSRDPLNLSKTDIEAIIDYHRKQRARRAAGEKPTKPSAATADISSVMDKLIKSSKPKPTLTRRF